MKVDPVDGPGADSCGPALVIGREASGNHQGVRDLHVAAFAVDDGVVVVCLRTLRETAPAKLKVVLRQSVAPGTSAFTLRAVVAAGPAGTFRGTGSRPVATVTQQRPSPGSRRGVRVPAARFPPQNRPE